MEEWYLWLHFVVGACTGRRHWAQLKADWPLGCPAPVTHQLKTYYWLGCVRTPTLGSVPRVTCCLPFNEPDEQTASGDSDGWGDY